MKLPQQPLVYSRGVEQERNRSLELADKQNFKRNQDVEIGLARLILTSPNGSRYSITVDNAGVISATAI